MKKVFLLAGGLVAVAILGVASLYALQYKDDLDAYFKRRNKADHYSRLDFFKNHDQQFMDYIKFKSQGSCTDLVDMCRNMVHRNTTMEFEESYKENVGLMIAMMKDSELNNSTDKPKLKCFGRSLLLRNILHQLGVRSRISHALGLCGDEVCGHSFLEVFNTDSNKWEIQDPYLNIFYENTQTGERLGLLDVLLTSPEHMAPRGDDTRNWGDGAPGVEDFLSLFALVIIDNRENGDKSVVFINNRRMEARRLLEATSGPKQALRQYILKKWLDVIFIEV